MTHSDAQRVMLAEFAFREAGKNASLETMKAICYVMRNRVRAGWHGGDWTAVMENAGAAAAHDRDPNVKVDSNDRNWQRLLRDVDDVFYGGGGSGPMATGRNDSGEEGLDLEGSLCEKKHERLYWMVQGRPVRPWFTENIVRELHSHPNRTTMGLMMFFE